MPCEHPRATYQAQRHDQAKVQAHALRREALSDFWRKVWARVCGSARAVARRRPSLPGLTRGV